MFMSCTQLDNNLSESQNSERILTGQILGPDGSPQANAVVYLHGDSLGANTALSRATSPSGRQTLRATCDKEGRYTFKGDYRGTAYLEVDLGDSLGNIDSVSFDNNEIANKDQKLKPKGNVRIESSSYPAGSIVWIPELNREFTITGDMGSAIVVHVPPGHYRLLLVGGIDGDTPEHHLSVEEKSTEIITAPDTNPDEPASTSRIIAAWEFNNPAQPGQDSSTHGHHGVVGEGAPLVSQDQLGLDGKSGLRVGLASDFLVDNFAIEAKIFPTRFGAMNNIVVAEPPGRYGDGWQLRIDNGILKFLLRDEAVHGSEWQVVESPLPGLNQWIAVRAERRGTQTQLWINDQLVASREISGDIGQLKYDLGIGYDAMNQAFHDRYFNGQIDYIRIYAIDGTPDGEQTGLSSSSSTISSSSSSPVSTPIDTTRWLADWSFDSEGTPFQDQSGNGHHAAIGEGTPTVAAGILTLDGKSGFTIPMHNDFSRNDFAVEARLMPTAFGTMDNVLVMEPPGRYGDGWQLRIDNGVLRLHLRDENTQGTSWIEIGETPLVLNQWVKVRIDRKGDLARIFVDDILVDSKVVAGDVGQLTYDAGLGYDAMNQAFHDRYFKGQIDYIRYKAQ